MYHGFIEFPPFFFQTKKPVERTRKMKPIEEPKEAPPPPVEEAPPTEEKDAERFVYLARKLHLLAYL